jgi:exodeoxyribonuclease V alpha subunit
MSIVRQNNLSRQDVIDALTMLQTPRTIMRRGKPVKVDALVRQTAQGFGLSSVLSAEERVARAVKRLRSAEVEALEVDHSTLWGATSKVDLGQRAAVELAAREPFMIITGGPGTGKTTTAKTVIRLLTEAGLVVEAVAPTGKAAARITQQTGLVASTIHSRIKLAPGATNGGEFVETGVLVIDEASMLDVHVAAALFEAVSTGVRVVILGDVDQLPSVEVGAVLRDLIEAGVPTARLETIHRQASESRIPYVARDIRLGRAPQWAMKGTDLTAVHDSDPFQIADRIIHLVTRLIPEKKGIPTKDIQVLASQYDEGKDSHVGIVALNQYLQEAINPAVEGAPFAIGKRGYVLRSNDKVIHVKNNTALGVVNGQTGVVTLVGDEAQAAYDASLPPPDEVSDEEETKARPAKIALAVEFDGRVVFYSKSDARNELELAYVISVHKSQGSEWPCVVVCAPQQHTFSFTRALLYTAVTRASRYVMLVGPEAALNTSVANTRGMVRRTTLKTALAA